MQLYTLDVQNNLQTLSPPDATAEAALLEQAYGQDSNVQEELEAGEVVWLDGNWIVPDAILADLGGTGFEEISVMGLPINTGVDSSGENVAHWIEFRFDGRLIKRSVAVAVTQGWSMGGATPAMPKSLMTSRGVMQTADLEYRYHNKGHEFWAEALPDATLGDPTHSRYRNNPDGSKTLLELVQRSA